MTFELDADLKAIHQPVRLRIMALLYRERDVGFADTRNALGLTDGNLGAHANTLVDQGFITARHVISKSGLQVRYSITDAGSSAFQRYLATLQDFLGTFGNGPE